MTSTTPPPPAPDPSAAAAAAAAFHPVGRRRSRRRTHVKNIPKSDIDGAEAEVEKKIVALQKIIPGGDRLPVAELFQETAEYIFALETQVKALRFLAAFVQTSEKRKRKLGA